MYIVFVVFIAKNNAFLKAFPTKSPQNFPPPAGDFCQKVFQLRGFSVTFNSSTIGPPAAIERKSDYARPNLQIWVSVPSFFS